MNATRMYASSLAVVIGICLGLAQGDGSRTKRAEQLVVSTIVGEPYLTKNKATGEYSGFIKDLMDLIAVKLGRTYRFQEVKDGKYGSEVSPGQWNGMVGEVIKKEVDLAAAAITISSKREKVLDFTKPFMDLGVTILIKKPGYGIRSAEDLAGQTDIKYGVVSSGATERFFRNSSFSTYKKMWEFMSSAKPSVFETTVKSGVQRVRNSDSSNKYAFLIESATASYWTHQKPCNLMTVGEHLNSKGYGLATPMGSDLTEKLDLAVLELREQGDVQVLRQKWWKIEECSSGHSVYGFRDGLMMLVVASFGAILVSVGQ